MSKEFGNSPARNGLEGSAVRIEPFSTHRPQAIVNARGVLLSYTHDTSPTFLGTYPHTEPNINYLGTLGFLTQELTRYIPDHGVEPVRELDLEAKKDAVVIYEELVTLPSIDEAQRAKIIDSGIVKDLGERIANDYKFHKDCYVNEIPGYR